MELYFNPYPGAAKNSDEGIRLASGAAVTLFKLQEECGEILLPALFSAADGDLPPSKFILVRDPNTEFTIGSIIFKSGKAEREKLRLLLNYFSKGKVIDANDLAHVDNWTVSGIGASAPVLELAARNNAIALTIPTGEEWRKDILRFDGRSETLHNLWGQEDISAVKIHCIESLKNIHERFAARFNAKYCPGALNSAPDAALWESFGFFPIMERVKKRNYQADRKLIKSVDNTGYGSMLELILHGEGHRIFFVHRKDRSPEILIGGFYQKNQSQTQNDAIKNAKLCINKYSED